MQKYMMIANYVALDKNDGNIGLSRAGGIFLGFEKFS